MTAGDDASERGATRRPSGPSDLAESEVRFSIGPLPPPDELQRYESILPGAAERIISMAEGQATHRRQLERDAVDADIRDAADERAERRRGQYLGFAIGVVAIAGGTLSMVFSPGVVGQVGGVVIGGGALATIVTAFVTGKRPAEVS